MTTKPDDIPQWAWDEAKTKDGFDYKRDVKIVVARAILKAKNDALDEAARIAEHIGIPRVASGDRNLMVPAEIAKAIRNLKHETEV